MVETSRPTEQTGTRLPQIAAQIAEQRQKNLANKQSIAEALTYLPTFRDSIHALLIARIPALPSDMPQDEWDKLSMDEQFRRTGFFDDTKGAELRGETLFEDGLSIASSIRSKRYPRQYDRTGVQKFNEYTIDIDGLAEVLALEHDRARVVSKERKSTIPSDPMHIPMREWYPTIPANEREATMQDIQQFEEYIASITDENTIFTAREHHHSH